MPTDSHTRLERLFEAEERRLAREFLEIIETLRGELPEDELAQLMSQHRAEVSTRVFERGGILIAGSVAASHLAAGADTADTLRTEAGILTAFDASNTRAVRIMRESRLRLIREFTYAQRQASRLAMQDGIARGANPIEQARAFRDSIGLTRKQLQYVHNYRNQLERGQLSAALQRQLRDGRWDRSIRAAVRDGRALSSAQIERMVRRYQERWLKHRAETIARTEALRAVHSASDEMYAQAVEAGDLAADDLIRQWNTASSGVRDSHWAMRGQERPFGVPFISGDGNQLRYPGDIRAPASDTINCRCAVSTRIASLATAAVA